MADAAAGSVAAVAAADAGHRGKSATKGKRLKKKSKAKAASGVGMGEDDEPARGGSFGTGAAPPRFFCRPGALLALADTLVRQLHSSLVAEAAAAQVLKNLLWVCIAVVQCPQLAPPSCRHLLPPATRSRYSAGGTTADLVIALTTGEHAAAPVAGGTEARAGAPVVAATGAASGSENAGAGWTSWTLEAIASRLAPLLHTKGTVRGCMAMRWYAAVGSQLSAHQLHGVLHTILSPVARASDDESGKVHAAVRELAAEALQLLQRRASAPDFAAAYQQVQEAEKAARRKRKQRAALEAVSDPALTAQKRIAKNLGKRKAKKRKLERTKRSRDSGGSIGLGSRKKARRLSGGDGSA